MRGSGPDDDDRIIAVRGYFEGVEGPHDRADLYFDSQSFPGYCWLFPVGNGVANVGLGCCATHCRPLANISAPTLST